MFTSVFSLGFFFSNVLVWDATFFHGCDEYVFLIVKQKCGSKYYQRRMHKFTREKVWVLFVLQSSAPPSWSKSVYSSKLLLLVQLVICTRVHGIVLERYSSFPVFACTLPADRSHKLHGSVQVVVVPSDPFTTALLVLEIYHCRFFKVKAFEVFALGYPPHLFAIYHHLLVTFGCKSCEGKPGGVEERQLAAVVVLDGFFINVER